MGEVTASLSRFSYWLARKVWGFLLWFLRRPPVKRFRAQAHLLLPRWARERARENIVRQDRFARRYGLKLLTISFFILTASFLLSITAMVALQLLDNGWLTYPDDLPKSSR